ncbi:MAG: ABC transporter ATP-binding protein [Chloroflexi bacterium]|nr:ABC transporter ATP-binding protein [Chloroflexota bacterium]
MISARGLRKSYGAVAALRGIDLDIRRGEVFAFLGPNGAGKTTTVEILEGHRRRDGGEVTVFGHDPGAGARELKEWVGVVLQTTSVEPYLTVEETLNVFRGYYRSPLPTNEILDAVGLGAYRKTMVRKLSGGLQRRLDVGIGLAGDPELLFLDEPTTGFDPAARREAWEMVLNLKARNKTVFLTTHYMDEAEALADRVSIIVDGRIVATGKPNELAPATSGTDISFRLAGGSPPIPASLAAIEGPRGYSITTDEPTVTLQALTTWAIDLGVDLIDLSVARSSLEDVYLSLVSAPSTGERAAR